MHPNWGINHPHGVEWVGRQEGCWGAWELWGEELHPHCAVDAAYNGNTKKQPYQHVTENDEGQHTYPKSAKQLEGEAARVRSQREQEREVEKPPLFHHTLYKFIGPFWGAL